ncbi:MAG: NAD(P)-dependent oxidoreductase [Proteobacteria bacterium]|nr:NAD(P)-dependent oxidoreductase [Pseudomonadota bacterium]
MSTLITGSSGHLGEALMRTFRAQARPAVGVDVLPSAHTQLIGSIADRAFVRRALRGATHVIHAATLHKPHVATHSRQAFIDVNLTGTLNLLEEAAAAGVRAFVFTSTTSAFGRALVPPPGAPAAWIDEDVAPVPKNIYGATKVAAEDLCELVRRESGMACVVLRTSRFFPEDDDDAATRAAYDPRNAKANEFLSRRVDLEDAVSAHLLTLDRAPALGFARFIISATTPFTPEDLALLRVDAPAALRRRVPEYESAYARLGWKMFPVLDRVYANARAREGLGWRPRHDFGSVLARLAAGGELESTLAREVGVKMYHRSATI